MEESRFGDRRETPGLVKRSSDQQIGQFGTTDQLTMPMATWRT
jgi:hypothetical protein